MSRNISDDFHNDESRQKYLNDLARLRRMRAQSSGRQTSGQDEPAEIETDDLYPDEDESRGAGDLRQTRVPDERQTGRSTPDRKQRRRKKHHPLRNLLIIAGILLAGFGVYTLFFAGSSKATGNYTIAVYGVDSRNGNLGKDALSDVNMIVNIDRATGDIKIVSVYRDTYIQINQKGVYHKFNEAYFRGGPEQSIWAMENNLDIHPEDYVTFNWKAVVDSINIMGGVDIDITEPEFKYINSFITETVNSTGVGSTQLTHAGANHLDGVQAVAYARLRLMDSDYNRTERQRRVVGLLVDKIKQAGLAKRMELVTSVLPETSTSMTVNDLIPFAKDAGKYHIGETTGFPFDKVGVDVEKKDCVVAVTLESNVVALHKFLYGDENYQASASVKKISDHIIQVTGLTGNGKSVKVSTDDKSGAPIGPTSTKAGNETEPEVKIEETTNPLPETEAASEQETTAAAETQKATKAVVDYEVPDTEQGPGTVVKKTTAAATTQEVGPGVKKTTAAAESTSAAKETVKASSAAETAAVSGETSAKKTGGKAETAGPGAGL